MTYRPCSRCRHAWEIHGLVADAHHGPCDWSEPSAVPGLRAKCWCPRYVRPASFGLRLRNRILANITSADRVGGLLFGQAVCLAVALLTPLEWAWLALGSLGYFLLQPPRKD